MKVFSYDIVAAGAGSPQYVSIHDPDTGAVRRRLYIEDSEGRSVTLKGEEIGQLYKFIKPALAG